jgi:putative membrane protein insertion efficiency factor
MAVSGKIYKTIQVAIVFPVTVAITTYQLLVSPILGKRCRFYPSCSHYSIESVKIHGILVGFFLISKRLLKCHPYHRGGWDPVPDQYVPLLVVKKWLSNIIKKKGEAR